MTIIIHLLIIIALYSIAGGVYRYILRPRYRWHQRGNVCYDSKREFALFVTAVVYLIGAIIYYN